MRCILFPLLLLGSLASLLAQPLTSSPVQLSFGLVADTQTDSLPLTLSNPHSAPVRITGLRLYDTYGQPAFSTSLDSATVPPGQSLTLQVYFHPRHNILHNSELIVLTASPRGALRIDLQGQGTFANSYYQSTRNLSEQALKDALHARLGQGYQAYSYNAAREEMYAVIDNQQANGQGASTSTLEGVYTSYTITGFSTGSSVRSEVFSQGINTEHTWPQSLFNQDLPMRSDLFHLFPTEIGANATRSSDPFGVVSNPTWQQGGSQSGNGVFEPRDVQKGPTARAMFYFVLRYQNYGSFLNSQEAVLRQWHAQYPPDAVEQRRNDDIFAFQNNRNPFIDYPQLIERISSLSGNSVASTISQVDLPQDRIELDSVAVGDTARFHYVLVNTGNQTLALSNLSFSDPQLSLAPAQTVSGPVAPGDAALLAVRLIPESPGELSAQLSFSLNVPGQEAVQVPIRATLLGTANQLPTRQETGWHLAPNPATDRVWLTRLSPAHHASRGSLSDLTGRTLLRWTIPAGTSAQPLSLGQLPAGLYWLRQGPAPAHLLQVR